MLQNWILKMYALLLIKYSTNFSLWLHFTGMRRSTHNNEENNIIHDTKCISLFLSTGHE